jgi:hypothetical protein
MENAAMRGPRAQKTKMYTVDTRKPRANTELLVFLNPANRFQEHISTKPSRRAPIFRYFFYIGGGGNDERTKGVPKAQLEAAFAAAAAAAAAAAPPPPPPPAAVVQLPPAPAGSQGSYGAMHEDEGIDDLANFLAEQGVASQGEFDELAALMEQKVQIGGRRRKSRKSRKSHKHSRRSSRRR